MTNKDDPFEELLDLTLREHGYQVSLEIWSARFLKYAKTAPQLSNRELKHLILTLLILNQSKNCDKLPLDVAAQLKAALNLVYAERDARGILIKGKDLRGV